METMVTWISDNLILLCCAILAIFTWSYVLFRCTSWLVTARIENGKIRHAIYVGQKRELTYSYFLVSWAFISVLLCLTYGSSAKLWGHLFFASLIIVASCIDYMIMILPNIITIWGFVLAVPVALFLFDLQWWDCVLGIVCGCGGFILIAQKYGPSYGMGYGDIKMMCLLGALVGLHGLPVLLLGCVSGIIIVCPFMRLLKKTDVQRLHRTRISLGPFLGVGWLLEVVFGEAIRDMLPIF